MKYRIKIEKYKDGNCKYYPQYYKGCFSGWKSLYHDGDRMKYATDILVSSREEALRSIDLCEKGFNELVSVEFEYINK